MRFTFLSAKRSESGLGQVAPHWLFLDVGQYAAAGVCDDDCTDLDLFVYRENSKLLNSDEEVDPAPVVFFSVEAPAEYFFEVRMYECRADTCFCSVQLFSKN